VIQLFELASEGGGWMGGRGKERGRGYGVFEGAKGNRVSTGKFTLLNENEVLIEGVQ
jgi:hypothetical protein